NAGRFLVQFFCKPEGRCRIALRAVARVGPRLPAIRPRDRATPQSAPEFDAGGPGRDRGRHRSIPATFPTWRLYVEVREMERYAVLACAPYAGSDTADFVHERKFPVFSEDPPAHVPRARKLDFLAADRDRRVVGDAL